jgi:GxxExxY protein
VIENWEDVSRKNEGFHFSFETSFPIIPSNQIFQYNSPCGQYARPIGERRGERILEKSKLNQLSSLIIKGAINVHKELGPGLLESVYRYCLAIEFEKMGLNIHSEVPVPICYQGQKVHEGGLRLDLLVEDTIVVELKSVEKVQDVHKKQLLTYLRLAKKPLGLLINFNEPLLRDGLTRIINAPEGAESLA